MRITALTSFPWLSYPKSPGLARTSLAMSVGEGDSQRRKMSQLLSSKRVNIPLTFCLEFVHLVKMNKLVFCTKKPQSPQDFRLCGFISFYHSSRCLFCYLTFLFSLYSKPLYSTSLPWMWLSHGHMLLCLWLLVITFAYVFAHYNVISLRSRSCNRSYQKWHHAVLFLQGSFLNLELSFLWLQE